MKKERQSFPYHNRFCAYGFWFCVCLSSLCLQISVCLFLCLFLCFFSHFGSFVISNFLIVLYFIIIIVSYNFLDIYLFSKVNRKYLDGRRNGEDLGRIGWGERQYMDEKYIFNKRKAAKLIKIALCSISEKKRKRTKERERKKKIEERYFWLHCDCYSVPGSWQVVCTSHDFTLGLCAWTFSCILGEPNCNFSSWLNYPAVCVQQ